mmetsp:Transcript_109483/g.337962  ORF Transcript_109483/g.337962 Transcript_109483/m.337962 type:complete len:205 (-) Transcript_109483:34-648(-)
MTQRKPVLRAAKCCTGPRPPCLVGGVATAAAGAKAAQRQRAPAGPAAVAAPAPASGHRCCCCCCCCPVAPPGGEAECSKPHGAQAPKTCRAVGCRATSQRCEGEKARVQMSSPLEALMTPTSVQLEVSHARMSPEAEPENRRPPSGENTTLQMEWEERWRARSNSKWRRCSFDTSQSPSAEASALLLCSGPARRVCTVRMAPPS